MRSVDLIVKKRDKQKLSFEEIEFLIMGYVKEEIPDYQVSSFLMASFLNGLDDEETYNLTKIMRDSGDKIDLSPIHKTTLDKHSTGGVGDKTSLIIGPILACFDIAIPKMSGRGLGHTGGTIDKLESIPGFKVELTREEFIEQVNKIGLALIAQTGNITPADKKLYALRDVTGTVNSIPLIVGSIMSKKLAAGADNIVLDVKCGTGAFMKDLDDAEKLAKGMVKIGKDFNKNIIALITNMNQPLGYAVGNALEVIEVIETLKGKGPQDLLELSLAIVSQALIITNKALSIEEANKITLEKINNGEALKKLGEMIEAQGGNREVINDYKIFNIPKSKIEITSEEEGYVENLEVEKIGYASMLLGAGRAKKEDIIDPTVGIKFYLDIGSQVKKGDLIAEIFYNDTKNLDETIKTLKESIKLSKEEIIKEDIIYKIIK